MEPRKSGSDVWVYTINVFLWTYCGELVLVTRVRTS